MLGPRAVNVLHISESDAAGGAARTAYKIHRGLRQSGHLSRMLVGRKVTADADIRSIKRSDAWRAADRVAGSVTDAEGMMFRILVERAREPAGTDPVSGFPCFQPA